MRRYSSGVMYTVVVGAGGGANPGHVLPGSEMQEAEISLPIVSRPYEIDLSRIRSHFIPGAPLDIMVSRYIF